MIYWGTEEIEFKLSIYCNWIKVCWPSGNRGISAHCTIMKGLSEGKKIGKGIVRKK